MQDDPTNRCIISRLFDLITDDIFFLQTHRCNQDLPIGTNKFESNILNDESTDEAGQTKQDEEGVYKGQGREFDISSSDTIKWCCSIALHLLQLSLNTDENRPSGFKLNEIKSDK